jgi:hypothetical protein
MNYKRIKGNTTKDIAEFEVATRVWSLLIFKPSCYLASQSPGIIPPTHPTNQSQMPISLNQPKLKKRKH